ncbi:MAG: hypothetical protein SNJ52_03540 [Verrucomicrobiia bacterium]
MLAGAPTAAWIGVQTGLARLPADLREKCQLVSPGEPVKIVREDAVGSSSQRALNDFLFARSAGVRPPEGLSVRPLPVGTEGIAKRSDLDYVLVLFESETEALWVEARSLGIDPQTARGGEQ